MVEKPALRPGVGETLLGDYGLLSEVQKDPIGPLWVGRRAGETDARALVLVRPLVVDQLAGDGIVEELEQAAGWARLLEHEALLPVVDFVSEDDKLAIVSQYVEGELLSVLLFRANLRRQHFPVAVVLRIVLDVLEGLAFLHEQLDAPSDLYRFGTASPEGIYVGLDGRARIIEPGVSAVLAQVDAWGGDAKRLAYRAPEQLDDAGELGPTTDVFTAGAILWEMLGKRRLIAGSSAEVIAKNLVEQPIPRVDSLKGPGIRAITEELASVVAQALERATDQRLSSVQALASAVRGAGAKVGDHEEVARYVDELHGQTLLERHRKIEQAFTAPRASGPGRGAASSPGAGSKPAVAGPQPFAATPSSKGDDDGEPGSLTADAAAEEQEAEPSPKREIPAPKAKKKPPATSQEAPPPPKRRKGPPRKKEPEADEPADAASSSRKESAVVTMPAPRSQLARRRRSSTDKMKGALLGPKKKAAAPPRRKKQEEAEELDGAAAAAAPADDGERDDEQKVAPEASVESSPGEDDAKPAGDSGPGAEEALADDADVADVPDLDQDEDSPQAPAEEPDESSDQPSEPPSEPDAEDEKEPAAKAHAEGKAAAPTKKPKTGAAAKDERKPEKGAKAQDDRKSKPAAKGATAAAAASAKEPVAATDLEVEEPKSRWPMMAALAALVAAVVIVFAMRSGSDDTSPAPGAGSPSARPSPVPPPGPTGEPRPSATEPAVTGDEPAPEPPPPTTAAPATSPAPPLAEPTVAPKPPAPPKTAPTVAPKPPKPPPPKPPPVKPPPPKPPGEFDPGGI